MKAYTIIRSDEQYTSYCNDLEKLTTIYNTDPSDALLDLIDTITLLIEKYDENHSQLKHIDPIQLLKYLMDEHKLNQKDLAELLRVSKGHLSDILNYKKGLSKKNIRILSERFKVRQSAFNRAYQLTPGNKNYKKANITSSGKDLKVAEPGGTDDD